MSITFPEKKLPTIAIVGRTNVGKSALFNRIVEEHKAIVSTVPGTTRTSNIASFLWRGQTYRLIDTGGLDFDKKTTYEAEIKKQIDIALREAQVVIFLVDLLSGLMPQEKDWARALHRLKLPIMLVGNKADNIARRQNIHDAEWRKLGFEEPTPVSAVNGSGVGDLLDLIIAKIKYPASTEPLTELNPLRVTIIGRPNVGKSSLFNALLGEERVIVSPIPHTTRETHDTLLIKDGAPFLFMDTAGLRRQSRVDNTLEKISVRQVAESLSQTQVALLVLDASEPFHAQDKHLAMLIEEKRKNVILVLNKWDLYKEQGLSAVEYFEKYTASFFPFLRYAPLIFVSAKTHWKIHKLFELIKEIGTVKPAIEEIKLQEFFKNTLRRHLPTRGKGVRHPKIYSLKQVDIAPPTFQVTVKQKTSVHESYLRFIENQLREEFGFIGQPVIVYVKKVRV